MDFRNECLGSWIVDEEYEKAQLLWLWYDYYTEVYDRSLWGTVPSKHDDTIVVFKSFEAQALSDKNAQKTRKEIYGVAEHYNISHQEMQKAKIDGFRSRTKMQRRIDAFLEYEKLGKFDFMFGD